MAQENRTSIVPWIVFLIGTLVASIIVLAPVAISGGSGIHATRVAAEAHTHTLHH